MPGMEMGHFHNSKFPIGNMNHQPPIANTVCVSITGWQGWSLLTYLKERPSEVPRLDRVPIPFVSLATGKIRRLDLYPHNSQDLVNVMSTTCEVVLKLAGSQGI